jgi:hypothetical protein
VHTIVQREPDRVRRHDSPASHSGRGSKDVLDQPDGTTGAGNRNIEQPVLSAVLG